MTFAAAGTGADTCWVLNLDAEFELQDPDGYRRSPRMAAHLARFAAVLGPRIRAWSSGVACVRQDAHRHDGAVAGRAYCPTPAALAELAARGAAPPAAPPLAVLQRVNHRRFSADVAGALGVASPRAAFVSTASECLRWLREGPWPAHGWLLKRPLGFSGRQRKRLVGPGELDAAAERWIEASMAAYGRGVMVEPFEPVAHDFAAHGEVAAGGAVTVHAVRRQLCSADGAWLEGGGERSADAAAVEPVARGVGAALQDAGYFGPFSVDGYRTRAGALRPLSEVNARYTMGWFG